MIGVVLWSDLDDRKAVFWCEDQGDLAFYQETDAVDEPGMFFAAGDMVQFDTEVVSRMRKASNARLLEGEACRNLPRKLRDTRQPQAVSSSASARILPFVAPMGREEHLCKATKRKA